MVPLAQSSRLYNLNQVLHQDLGVLPLKTPYLNTVQAQFLQSDQSLCFFPRPQENDTTTSYRKPIHNLPTRTRHALLSSYDDSSLFYPWSIAGYVSLYFKKFFSFIILIYLKWRGSYVHLLSSLDQNTLHASLCYLDSQENSKSSQEQLRFMIPQITLTVQRIQKALAVMLPYRQVP